MESNQTSIQDNREGNPALAHRADTTGKPSFMVDYFKKVGLPSEFIEDKPVMEDM